MTETSERFLYNKFKIYFQEEFPMNPYALIDLHCDTLTDCIHKGLTPDL